MRFASILLVFAAATSFAAKPKDAISFSAQPLQLKSFTELGVTQDPDLQFFAANIGTRLGEQSSVRNAFYASKNFKKWVFVQAHLAVADKAEGEITTLPDGKSFFSIRGESNFFFLAQGFQREELFRLRKNIEKSLNRATAANGPESEVALRQWALLNWMLKPQPVQAAGSCLSSEQIQQQVGSQSDSDFKVLKSFWGCMEGKGNGIWNATGGVVSSAYDVLTKGTEQILCGAASVVNAAWSRCSDYATAMQNTVDSTLYTLGHLKQVAGEMVDDFATLPVDVQVKVYCELKTTLEASAAVSFVTAGAGAPAALSRMSQVLNKVAESSGAGKSAATLRTMALKVEQRAQQKATALANIKSLPQDVQESLKKIDNLKSEFSSNSNKVTEFSQKLDSQWQAVENTPSRYATENLLMNSQTRLENILKIKRSTSTEDKDLATQLLKYAKLSDKEKDLANKILDSKGTGITKHEADAAIMRLAESLKDSKLKLREDLKLATSEEYAKLTRDYIALEEKRVRAMRSVTSSKEKLNNEISRYWNLVEQKNLSQQDKEILKAQVSTYMTASLCGAVGSVEVPSQRATDGVR